MTIGGVPAGTPLFCDEVVVCQFAKFELLIGGVGELGSAPGCAILGCMNLTLKLLLHFLYHILVAAVMFGAVAGVASLLWYGTMFMQEHGIPAEIYVVCYIVAELLFAIDVICLLFFIGVEGWILLREIAERLRTKEE